MWAPLSHLSSKHVCVRVHMRAHMCVCVLGITTKECSTLCCEVESLPGLELTDWFNLLPILFTSSVLGLQVCATISGFKKKRIGFQVAKAGLEPVYTVWELISGLSTVGKHSTN